MKNKVISTGSLKNAQHAPSIFRKDGVIVQFAKSIVLIKAIFAANFAVQLDKANMNEVIALTRIPGKNYHSFDQAIIALQLTIRSLFEVKPILITCTSSPGKTTPKWLLNCVIYPSNGKSWKNGRVATQLKPNVLKRGRLETSGFVVQSFNLSTQQFANDDADVPLRLQNQSNSLSSAGTSHAENANDYQSVGLYVTK